MKKEFICSCVNPIWETDKLIDIIDNAKKISKKEFFDNCDVNEDLISNIKEYPYDFEFYKNGEIMFFTHSAIESFYK